MLVAGASGRIFYVRSSAPGREHDSTIFNESALFKKLSRDKWRPFENGLLIGDSAYCGTNSFLANPFSDATGDPREQQYNRSFVRARVTIEQVIGRVKSRFPILMGTMRHKKMETCGKIVQVCCALNNYILSREGNEPAESPPEPDPRLASIAELDNFETRNGRRRKVQTKEKILQLFF